MRSRDHGHQVSCPHPFTSEIIRPVFHTPKRATSVVIDVQNIQAANTFKKTSNLCSSIAQVTFISHRTEAIFTHAMRHFWVVNKRINGLGNGRWVHTGAGDIAHNNLDPKRKIRSDLGNALTHIQII